MDSVLVEFRIHRDFRFDIHDLPTFERVVQAAFSQRRKMIRNALASPGGFTPEVAERSLEESGIVPTRRAEEVAIKEFVRLANLIYKESKIV